MAKSNNSNGTGIKRNRDWMAPRLQEWSRHSGDDGKNLLEQITKRCSQVWRYGAANRLAVSQTRQHCPQDSHVVLELASAVAEELEARSAPPWCLDPGQPGALWLPDVFRLLSKKITYRRHEVGPTVYILLVGTLLSMDNKARKHYNVKCDFI